jgi:hypothetical protein
MPVAIYSDTTTVHMTFMTDQRHGLGSLGALRKPLQAYHLSRPSPRSSEDPERPSASRLAAKERALIAPTSPPAPVAAMEPARRHALAPSNPRPVARKRLGLRGSPSSWPCLGQCVRVRLQCSGGKPGGWRHTAAAAANRGRPTLSPCMPDASLRGQGAVDVLVL